MIYRDKAAKELFKLALKDRSNSMFKGYFFEQNAWVAFDNSTKNFWVEEFDSEEKAICWLENIFEAFELENFISFKLNSKLLYIPNKGYLALKVSEDKVRTKFFSIG